MRRVKRPKFFRPELLVLEDRTVPSAGIIYVDANVAAHSTATVHDGSSWAQAFDNLQAALTEAAATPGLYQIWIAEGTYKPSQIYTPLDANGNPVIGGAAGLNVASLKTFNLPDGVSLYGGFVSGMTSLAQRDPGAYPTILSGDLQGNDVNNPSDPGYAASKADNAWHVVTAGNDVTRQSVTVTLDGLRITDGYAIGPNNGGTLSPFIWGHADGGGVYSAWGSRVTLNDDVFLDNFAASDGGGVFSNTSDLVATNSTFLNNAALIRAGGLEGLNGFESGISHTSTLVNDYFQGNTCAVFGGAVVGEGAFQGPNSAMSIQGSTFVHNQAAEGGAIVLDTLPVTIGGCSFLNNVATVDAGAVATTNVVGTFVHAPHDFATTISYSLFQGNVCLADPAAHVRLNDFLGVPGLNFANGGGALVAYMNGYLNVDHDVFIQNVTQNGDGGAILNGDASANLLGISAFTVQTTVTDSLFLDNQALHGNGGAIASESDGLSPTSTPQATTLTVLRSAFFGNQSSGNGGAIYLANSVATITDNLFAFDAASSGDGIYGTAVQVNGVDSNDLLAALALEETNTFLRDDVVLS
jgi:predicted outer membrane repeat protein